MGDGVGVFTEIIVYNHQPDADTFVCKAGIEPAELCQNTLDIAVWFLINSPSGA